MTQVALSIDRSTAFWTNLSCLLLGVIALVQIAAAEPVSARSSTANEPSPEWIALQAALPDSVLVPGRLVYVDFWASWCPPCRKSFPWMAKMHASFKPEELTIIAVCLDRDASKGVEFAESTGAEFTIVYDSKAKLPKLFDVGGMPTSFLFNESRQIVSKHTGFTKKDAEELEVQWRFLLKKDHPSTEGTKAPDTKDDKQRQHPI